MPNSDIPINLGEIALKYEANERMHGQSKYSYSKMINFALELLLLASGTFKIHFGLPVRRHLRRGEDMDFKNDL